MYTTTLTFKPETYPDTEEKQKSFIFILKVLRVKQNTSFIWNMDSLTLTINSDVEFSDKFKSIVEQIKSPGGLVKYSCLSGIE